MARKRFELFPIRYANAPSVKLPVEEPDTEFKRKFPPDAQLGQELTDNARVWRVYRDEAIQHDDGVLAGWNNTIDILLTFAGLFSAAVTAFVVESYQFLQPPELDFGAALYALAVNDTATLHTLAASTSHPGSAARWINGLWLTSLFFALAAAFLCILVKQWLDEYTARTRASSQNPKHWSRRRVFYFRAIDDWGVAGIISLLPLLLHAALFLFFAGMVVLIWSLSRALAAWLFGLACLLFLLYAVSVLIPVWNAACPFATPLAKQLRKSWNFIYIWALRRGVSLSELAAAIAARWRYFWRIQPDLEAACPHPRSINLWMFRNSMQAVVKKPAFDQLLHLESLSTDDAGCEDTSVPHFVDLLDYEALCWLILSVSDSDSNAVGIQALGALEPCTPLAELLSRKSLSSSVSRSQMLLASPTSGSAAELARTVRSLLALDDSGPRTYPSPLYILDHVPTAREYWRRIPWNTTYPDLQLLKYALCLPLNATFPDDYHIAIRDKSAKRGRTSSLHSTAMLLSSLKCVTRQNILLFLLYSDLTLVSGAQWKALMPKLRHDTSSCPHRTRLTPCNLTCFTELISSFLLRGPFTVDLDPLALTQLFDAACLKLTASVLLPEIPTSLAYLASGMFVSYGRTHSIHALRKVASWIIERPRSGPQGLCFDPLWLTVWRHAAYFLRLKYRTVDSPSDLIVTVLDEPWTPNRHRDNPVDLNSQIRSVEVHIPREAIVRVILSNAADGTDQSIPSVWGLIVTQRIDCCEQFCTTAESLATFLCTASRNGDSIDDLTTSFLSPLTFVELMTQLYFYRSSADVIGLINPLVLCSHIMEIRPSWWIEGMNQLMHDDESPPVEFPSGYSSFPRAPVPGSKIQAYAAELTEKCLRRGPCYECPRSVTPLAFDVSLRVFAVYPFAVYPIIDADIESDG